MGIFEQILLTELQRQQHRAQFCDTILQAQGISVPVHSCVLSAFSPRLCEFLSSLPALPDGKSRVIELQAVEAYTLLRLVSTLYSGTVEGERGDLQMAANKLGITLPPGDMEVVNAECKGGEERVKDGTLKERGRSKEGEENRVTSRREYKDVGTQIDVAQTDRGRQATAINMQTDPVISSSLDDQFTYEKVKLVELQSVVPVIDHMSQFPWVTDGCCQTSTIRSSLVAHSDDLSGPKKMPSTLDDATVCQLFTGAAMGASHPCPSLFPPPPEDQPVQMDRLHMGDYEGGGVDGGGGGGEGQLMEGFEQFEGNIPEFISYFLDSAGTRRQGRRMRRGPRGAKQAEKRGGQRAKRGGRGGSDKGGEERQAIEKVERRFPLREGRPVELIWRGIGGGRIGRPLHLPPRKKTRPKSYNRQNSTQGKTELNQDKVPVNKRPRGRPRIRLLPLPARFTQPESGVLDPNVPSLPPAPNMLHTAPLPTTTPPRSLLEQLLFELNQPTCGGETLDRPSTQHIATTTTPRVLCPLGNVQDKSSQPQKQQQQQQQQPDGEVSDILDHLMQSLEQPANMMPYTIIKDLQKWHQRGQARDGGTQPHTPLLAHTASSAPQPTKCRATGGTGKKMIMEEIGLSAEMFEERRMTRNQAKLLRTSSTMAWATSSTGQDKAVPKRPQPGKNMNKLRQKLLGKRKGEEEKREGEEVQMTESSEETSPSASKKPKVSSKEIPSSQSPHQAEGSD